jgi:galactosylceramidase
MEQDSELRAAVARVGEHYRKTQSPANAQAIGCPLWMSEDGPWRGDWTGAETLARMFNRNYITGKYTKTIIWSLITSYYDVLPLPDSGPMMAKEPWSGYYEVQPALWIIAHTTQFTHPGWRYLDAGCGLLDGGSYVTLRSPGRAGDYSIILETTEARQPQTVQFQVQGLSGGSLHVWRSNSQAQFEQLPDLATADGTFSVTLDPDAIYSLTTTAGQQKGRSLAPPSAEFPLPYADDFESYRPGKYARYFSDQGGVFEVARRPDGKGQCLRQVLETNGIDWPFHPTPEPYSLIGSAHWRDYEVSVSTLIETTGSVSVWGRIQASLQNAQPAKGYWLQIASDGQWQLHAFTNLLAAGTILVAPHQWHDLTLRFSGSAITALVDHRMIQTLQDHAFSHGMAGVGSGWNTALFDDFSLRPVANPDFLNSQTSGVAK